MERVIRVPRSFSGAVPDPQDIVRTEDGVHYRIDFVQSVPGVWPPCLDLTLVRYSASMEAEQPEQTLSKETGSGGVSD